IARKPDDLELRHCSTCFERRELSEPHVSASLIENVHVEPGELLICVVSQERFRSAIFACFFSTLVYFGILHEFAVMPESDAGSLREIPQISRSRLGNIIIGNHSAIGSLVVVASSTLRVVRWNCFLEIV